MKSATFFRKPALQFGLKTFVISFELSSAARPFAASRVCFVLMPRTTVPRLEELGSHSNWERTRVQYPSSSGETTEAAGRDPTASGDNAGQAPKARADRTNSRLVSMGILSARERRSDFALWGDARTPVRKELLCRERQSSCNSAQSFRAVRFGFRSVRMRSNLLPRRERPGARDGKSCPTRNPRDESGVGRRTTVSGTGLERNNWGDIRGT